MPSDSWVHYARLKKEKKKIIAIEGPNGSGKTTLCELIAKHLKTPVLRGVPADWEYPPLKTRILESRQWMTSAMYFLSGALALPEDMPSSEHIILDRCVWSTLAIHAAADPERLPDMFRLLDLVAHQLKFPDLTIVLDASYSTCCERIGRKNKQEQEWDKAAPHGELAHTREMDFFRWLASVGVPVIFVDANVAQEQIAGTLFGIIESC